MAMTNDGMPSDLERATMRRVTRRLLPFLMACYLVSFIDRVNVGFAALQMNKDVGLTASMFGLGSGLFFVTYFIFEVPSNLVLEKVGARLWIARIMITWGLVSAATALVVGPYSFYLVRFLLGAAEAGFYPGVLLYLTFWFPKSYRARVVALFMVSVPAASFIGSPISAALLRLDGWLGLHGWQWMSIVEAAPAILLGGLAFFVLPDTPLQAKWLTAEQRRWLTDRIKRERDGGRSSSRRSTWRVLIDKHVLAAGLIFAGSTGASACLSIWQPQILKSFGLSNMETGLLNSAPFGVAAVLMVLWAKHSDRTGERVWHLAIPLAATSLSLLLAFTAQSLLPTVAILFVAIVGTYAIKGPFWALSTEWMSTSAAAVGIAQINAIGNLGGFVGTYSLGVIKEATGSYALGLLPLALLTAAGTMLTLVLGFRQSPAEMARLN
ncbi:MFS transporter [Bradyrhizobium erythrophlei]|jgi:ACS family tartrate transporter-like MFS transporter|uniref:Nitrate/nitrite transporter NarK n=1 Tax=Bradyrhizobium erythrophlei TaxID=1437360 RepID=A0A1M5SEE3_9BRAD|nr:MFS transporter [Bradyrhizobium erythrophlei]SHH36972.1 Nitrate/nitrite transporter NarK [Bradyrhizobium erythrophlei]